MVRRRRTAVVLACAMVAARIDGADGSADSWLPRRMQSLQMTTQCAEAIDAEPGKSVAEIASCINTCMREVDGHYERGLSPLNDPAAGTAGGMRSDQNWHVGGREPSGGTLRTDMPIELGAGAGSMSACQTCVLALTMCAGETREQERARAVQAGVGQQGGWLRLDITAEDFTCRGTIQFGNETTDTRPAGARILTLTLTNLCYPAVCSYMDIENLFQYDVRGKVGARTNFAADASCDILATFLDSSAPWWILVLGIFYVIGNIAMSRSSNLKFLRCMLWCYMSFDIAVGMCLMVYGFLVISQGNMPPEIKIIMPLFGAVQVHHPFIPLLRKFAEWCVCKGPGLGLR